MNLGREIGKRFKIKSAGLQINYIGNNKYTYQLVILEKANSRVKCIQNDNYNNIEQVVKDIPPLLPINIGIDGKEVLTRKISDLEPGEPLQSILPNASSKDFVVHTTHAIWQKPLVSIIRKSTLKDILDLLNKKGLFPFSVSLGVSPLVIIAKLLSSHDSIRTPNYTIKVNDGVFSDLIKEDNKSKEYNLEGQVLSSELLVPFSLAMNYFINDNSVELNDPAALKQKREYVYKKRLKYTFISYLIGLFIILLTNSIIYGFLMAKYNGMSSQLVRNKEIATRTEHLKHVIGEKQLLLGISDNNENELFSFYADRIANSLPSEIILKSMVLAPLSENIRTREENLPGYNSNQIIIEGLTAGSKKLNDWISVLTQYKWIDNLRIINYQEELETGQATFKIELKLSNNE